MEQNKEIYERLALTVTEFDAEDVISTSEVYFSLQECGVAFKYGL